MNKLYKIAVTATFALAAVSASAQSAASYFMPNAVERVQHNASFAPSRGYFNVPAIGAISMGVNGNIALSDFIMPNSDGQLATIFDTSISADQALSNLKDYNTTGMESRIGILGFGKYCQDKQAFWNFDIALVTSMNMSMPYEMVEFFKTAPAQTTISDVNMYMESYAEIALGYSRKVGERLTVGGRVKGLVGLMSAEFNIDKMDVTMDSSQWMASASGTLNLNASGMELGSSVNEKGVEVYDLGDIQGTPDGIAGYGFAVDLGATYDLTDKLHLSLGVNDLGMMMWSADANTSAKVANSFAFEGTTYDANSSEMSGTDDIEISDIVLEAQDSHSTTNSLQSSLTLGANYEILGNFLSAGIIYEADFWKSKTLNNYTLVATFTPMNLVSVAASYAMSNNSGNTVGLAANVSLGFLNIYLATDVLMSKKSVQYIPINQSAMNLTFGLSFAMGPKGEREM